MIAVIGVEKQSVITGDQETIEGFHHFVTTEAGIAIAGTVMIASEVADPHLLKDEPVHQIIQPAKIGMGHQTWILTALGEAPGMVRSQVAHLLLILYSRLVLLVVMDVVPEALVDVEEGVIMRTTMDEIRHRIPILVVVHSPLLHRHLKFQLFGSTSSNIPLSSAIPKGPKAETSGQSLGPVPGVSVPTAPRVRPHAFGRPGEKSVSAKWISPEYAAREKILEAPPSENTSLTSENKPSPTEEHSNHPQSPNLHTDGRQVASKSEEGVLQANVLRESLQTPPKQEISSPRREQTRQRRSISGRRPAENPIQQLHEITDDGSDSDSGDDLDDDFVEDDIKKAEEELAKANDEGNNPALPREEPDVVFLKPFIELSIDGKISAYTSTVPEACIPVDVPKQLVAEPRGPQSNLSVKPKARGRSRPTTPLAEPEAAAKPEGKW